MDQNASQILSASIDPGEKLLWSGMPRQGFIFRETDIVHISIGIIFFVASFFGEHSVLKVEHISVFFELQGILFFLIGLYLSLVRLFLDKYIRANTYYGVTDKRAIIVQNYFGGKDKLINLTALNILNLTEKSDKRGSIVFGKNTILGFRYYIVKPDLFNFLPPEFEDIENMKKVYDIICIGRDAVVD